MMLVYRAGKADRMVRIMRYTPGLQLFIGLYCVFYLISFIWVIVLYCRSKRICQSQTVVFMLASFVFVIMSGHLTNQITKDSWRMQESMSSACDVNTKDGLLYDMDREFKLAQDQICQFDCPCNLKTRPRSQSVFIVKNGVTNVFNCSKPVVSRDSTYSKLFIQIEST